MAETGNTVAREYLRVSADPSGRLHSPAEQHDDNTRAAGSNGWRLGDPYAERDAVSASRYGSRARAAFDALCRDLVSGAFGADVLILWESSRGSRRVGEWVSLIEACETAGVHVHVTSHGRTYDPASARDRRSLLEDAVDSEYESAKISARTRRSKAAGAAAGLPNGKVPYGYTRTYDPVTRRLVSQDPQPAEAAVIAELYDRLRAGHSLKAIARDFDARGVRTRGSKGYPPRPFSPAYLRDLALRPGYGGLRVHQPVTGIRDRRSVDGAVPAAWPPLTDAETWHMVHAMLTNPSRRTSRPGRAVHLLSLIAACGQCGGGLTATYRGGGKRHDQGRRDYQCRDRSCVRVNAGELDAYAEAVMLAYLARPDVIAELRAGSDRGPELAKVRGDLAAARGELNALREQTAAGRLSVASLVAIEPGLTARITGLETRDRELSAPPELAALITPGEDVSARWDAAPVSARRRIARLLCQPAALGELLVDRDPRPGRGRTPVEDRVRWDRQP
jgi:DNA invertase Pin-like site-specific DNA recombinase